MILSDLKYLVLTGFINQMRWLWLCVFIQLLSYVLYSLLSTFEYCRKSAIFWHYITLHKTPYTLAVMSNFVRVTLQPIFVRNLPFPTNTSTWHNVCLEDVFIDNIPTVAERDAFDTLFDHAPDKLNVVKKVKALFSFTLISH